MKKASFKILLEALVAILCLILGAFIGVYLDRSGLLGPPVEHTGAVKFLMPLIIFAIIIWAIVRIWKQNRNE